MINFAAGSANGRPDDSGSSNPGSNPGPAAIFIKKKIRKRRYRLGVRTGDSQSSNRGSIPRSATLYLIENKVFYTTLPYQNYCPKID